MPVQKKSGTLLIASRTWKKPEEKNLIECTTYMDIWVHTNMCMYMEKFKDVYIHTFTYMSMHTSKYLYCLCTGGEYINKSINKWWNEQKHLFYSTDFSLLAPSWSVHLIQFWILIVSLNIIQVTTASVCRLFDSPSCAWIYIYIYIYTYIYAYICMYICMCVCVCVCMYVT